MKKIVMCFLAGLLITPIGWTVYNHFLYVELADYGLGIIIVLGQVFCLVMFCSAFYKRRDKEKKMNHIVRSETDGKIMKHNSYLALIISVIWLFYGIYLYFSLSRETTNLTIPIFLLFITLHYVTRGRPKANR